MHIYHSVMYVFAVNIKLGSERMMAALLAITAVVTAAVIIKLETTPVRPKGVSVSAGADSVVSYLDSFGLAVDSGKLVTDEVRVPTQFSDIYESYNHIQKAQGFDLSFYKGQTLTRYTYPVTNYPDAALDVFAEVLLSGDLIVGADIYCTNADGFIKALK